MLTLDTQHPANLCVGAFRIATRRADEARQNLIAFVCRDGEERACAAREIAREIATDAAYAVDVFTEISADGKITPAEHARLAALLREIRDEAVTGKIISP